MPETKQERQAPRIDQPHQRLDCRGGVNALDVPSPGHIEHADVIENQEPQGEHAHPVEVVPSVGREAG